MPSYPLYNFSNVIPLFLAIVWAFFNLSRASNVAFTTLCGFEEPCDFDNTSPTPTASRTVLTAPPAITPVPGAAGIILINEAGGKVTDHKGNQLIYNLENTSKKSIIGTCMSLHDKILERVIEINL